MESFLFEKGAEELSVGRKGDGGIIRYLALGADTAERARAYGELLRSGLADEDLTAIRSHIQQERALGGPPFQAMVAKTLNRSVAVRPRGRPRKIAGRPNESMVPDADSNR